MNLRIPVDFRTSSAAVAAAILVAGCAQTDPDTAQAGGGGEGFDRTFTLQGVTFHVGCPNRGSLNTLVITPSGLEVDNAPVREEVDGTVTGAEVADLNGDGSPEIYVYVASAGSGGYGSLVAYAANNKKSLSRITVPDLSADPRLSAGYQGHDEFAVVENVLARRFPVYRTGDPNSNPSGGTRQVQYKLRPGEAAWQLYVDRTTQY